MQSVWRCATSYNTNCRVDLSSQQRIGEVEEEGKGGHIRATLLSNRATTLVKVLNYFNTSFTSYDLKHSLKDTMKP